MDPMLILYISLNVLNVLRNMPPCVWQWSSYEVYEWCGDPSMAAASSRRMIRLVNVFTRPGDHCDEMLSPAPVWAGLKLTSHLMKCISDATPGRRPTETIYISLIRGVTLPWGSAQYTTAQYDKIHSKFRLGARIWHVFYDIKIPKYP